MTRLRFAAALLVVVFPLAWPAGWLTLPSPEGLYLWPAGAPGRVSGGAETRAGHRAGRARGLERAPAVAHGLSTESRTDRRRRHRGAGRWASRAVDATTRATTSRDSSTRQGIAAFVLKYRLARAPDSTYTLEGDALERCEACGAPGAVARGGMVDRSGEDRRHGLLRRWTARVARRDAFRRGRCSREGCDRPPVVAARFRGARVSGRLAGNQIRCEHAADVSAQRQ